MKEFYPFRLDTAIECLWRREDGGEVQIRLTPKAFAVLQYLVAHAGRLVTQDELLEAVWPNTCVQPEVLKNQILDIRRCLGDRPKDPRFIETLPRRGYQFIASLSDSSADRALGLASPSAKLVGREGALVQLRGSLETALRGQIQVVFVTGDVGIGKTALVDEFQHALGAGAQSVRVARGQCVEGYAGTEAYYPMLEALGQLCRGPDGNSIIQILAKHAPTWLVQFPAFLRHEQREMLQGEIRGATRERMLREISDALTTIASDSPLLLVFEDLHRADHSTVDLISALARRRQSGKLMLLGTYLPDEIADSNHPLRVLTRDLLIHSLSHEIALAPFVESEVTEYLACSAEEAAVPAGLAGLIHRYTGGNPLFVVTVVEHMRERRMIKEEGGRLILTVPLQDVELRAPETLRRMIEIRIERLSEEEQRVLEAASVVGDVFSAVIGAGAANIEVEGFQNLCEELARRRQMVRPAAQEFPDGTDSERYEFVHAMYREVLYRRQSSGRRARLHRCIAEQMEALYTQTTRETAAELALHFERSGEWSRAIKYLQLAAETAGRRFGPRQAAGILDHALQLVNRLPDSDQAQHEIAILEQSATICAASLDSRAVEAREVPAPVLVKAGAIGQTLSS